MPPVNVVQIETALISFDILFQRATERQEIVNFFIGPKQPVVRHILQPLNCILNIGFRKFVYAAFVVDGIHFLKLLRQH